MGWGGLCEGLNIIELGMSVPAGTLKSAWLRVFGGIL
jgi:hypothetical protein